MFFKQPRCLTLNQTQTRLMPQDKNLTIRKTNNTGKTICRSTYGAKFERQKKADCGYSQKIPLSKKKSEKTKILFTFIEQTGYNRKYAIHILSNEGKQKYAGKKLKVKITHQKGRK